MDAKDAKTLKKDHIYITHLKTGVITIKDFRIVVYKMCAIRFAYQGSDS